jgi:ARG and Rhodanese-Phosphatase-superfamily-associated Protein domain
MNTQIFFNSTSVRRKRRCHYISQPGAKKISLKTIFYSTLIFCFLVYDSSAQLTYEHLAVQYDSPWICGKLKLIPVRFKDNGGRGNNFLNGGLISFEEAFKEGKVSVKEISLPGGSDVSLLEVKNHTKKNVLLHSGEIVSGGRQDRAFGGTIIIPPGDDENYLPVFCVEKGRWDGKPRRFRYSGSADASLRKQIDVTKQQNKVWKEIDRQLEDEGMQNATWNYVDIYKDTSSVDTACLHFFWRKLMESDSAYSGFVAITSERIIDCQLFGSNDLCVSSFDVMLKSYSRSITAKDSVPQLSNDNVKIFLDKFLKTEAQQKEYLEKHGRLYTYQNHVIHLLAYDE